MITDKRAVQRQAEAEARAVGERVLREFGCPGVEQVISRIHQIYLGRFELRPRRLGPEYCPNHPRTRTPCGLCPPTTAEDPDDE